MGTVFKKQTTRKLPAGAHIVEKNGDRFAQWTDHRGTKREAKVIKGRNGQDRIVTTAAKYTAKYRDGSGRVVELATGCRGKEGANSVLGELMARAPSISWAPSLNYIIQIQTSSAMKNLPLPRWVTASQFLYSQVNQTLRAM
jgi:hypothetical protein